MFVASGFSRKVRIIASVEDQIIWRRSQSRRGGDVMRKLISGILMLGWIPTLAVVTGAKWIAGDAVAAQARTPVKVTRIYTGTDGKTKVEEFEIPLKPRDAGQEVSASVALTTLQVRRTTPQYFLDWHGASRRQLVVTLAGESEIELDGGRKLRLGPGHILLAEDTTGKGHISRAVAGKDRIALDIGLADGATLPR
jgi:hypothetical protein